MKRPPPDWQMPAGVDRGLWDYLHDPAIARRYDASLAGSSLFRLDLDFVAEHCQPPGVLFDLGCGTGRLLTHAAKLDYRPVGVDLSQEMLAVAAGRLREFGGEVSLIRASIVELDAFGDGCADHVACLFSTLGMVRGAEARRRVVAHVFRLLRPGGRFVLHVHNRWFSLYDPVGRRWLLRDLFARERGDRVMPPHQGIGQLTLHLFARGEAERLLTQAGFRLVEVRPVSLRDDGRVPLPWLFSGLRAYGFLIAAEKPAGCGSVAPCALPFPAGVQKEAG